MESFYSVSDKHLGLMLWVEAEYLICAAFICNSVIYPISATQFAIVIYS